MPIRFRSPLSWPVGRRVRARRAGELGLLERWYALQPVTRVFALRMELDEPVDRACLRAALERLRAHHPQALGTVLSRVGGRVSLRHDPTAALPCEWARDPRLSAWTLAELALHEPFVDGTPLWRVQGTRDGRGLVASFHHAVADGLSGAVFVRDLFAALVGEPLGAPTPLGEPPLEARLDLRPRIGSLLRELQGGGGEPVAFEAGPHQELGLLRTQLHAESLDADAVGALGERAREAGTTLHGALCAAALLASARHAGSSAHAARLMSPVSLRGRCEPRPDGMGVYLCGVESHLGVRPDTPFWELASRCKRALTDAVPGAAGRLGLLALADIEGLAQQVSATRPNGRTATVEVSNLGRLPALPEGVRVWFCQGNHYHGPLFNLSAATCGSSGELRLCLAAPAPLLAHTEGQQYLGSLRETLRGAMRAPSP